MLAEVLPLHRNSPSLLFIPQPTQWGWNSATIHLSGWCPRVCYHCTSVSQVQEFPSSVSWPQNHLKNTGRGSGEERQCEKVVKGIFLPHHSFIFRTSVTSFPYLYLFNFCLLWAHGKAKQHYVPGQNIPNSIVLGVLQLSKYSFPTMALASQKLFLHKEW